MRLNSFEINIIVSVNGKHAYISSDIEAGYGGYDIYRFELPSRLAPDKVTYLQGHVYDADSTSNYKANAVILETSYAFSSSLSVGLNAGMVSGDDGSKKNEFSALDRERVLQEEIRTPEAAHRPPHLQTVE